MNGGARSVVAGVLVLAVVAVGGTAPAQTPTLAQLTEAGRAEGGLLLVGGIWFGHTIKIMEDAFNKKYGLKTTFRFSPGASMPVQAGRLIEEAKAGQRAHTDVFVGTEAHMPRLYQAGALRSHSWRELFPHIPEYAVELEGTSLPFTSLFHGVTYNTKLVAKDEVPQLTKDLLNSKWKGKIASTPYAGAFDRVADSRVLGYEKTKAWVQALAKHLGGLIGCGEEERIASGEFLMLVFDCGRAAADVVRAATGAPLASTILEDAAVASYHYASVPKHAPHPALATLFTGFLLSREGQEALYRASFVSHHRLEGTPAHREYTELVGRGVKVTTFSAEYVMPRGKEIGAWRQEFQRILSTR